MAGAGYKLFATGDVLTAAQVNTYLNEQTVMVFADSAARTAALSGVLAEGMMSYLQDTNAVEVYNGTSWVNVGNAGDITEVQAGVGISIASGTGPIPVITNSSTDLITTAGDLLYGTAADTMARLGIGTAGQVLKVNSGATAPEWGAAGGASFVGVKATMSADLSVANNTYTAMTFDGTDIIDTDSFHNPASNNTRITIPSGKGGKYLVCAQAFWNTAGAAYRNWMNIRVNGAGDYIGDAPLTTGTEYFVRQINQIVSLTAGDYFEIYVKHNVGSPLAILANGQEPACSSVSVQYLGA